MSKKLTKNIMGYYTLPKYYFPIIFVLCFVSSATYSQSDSNKLLDEYINSSDSSPKIIFTADNIKQFWVNKTVAVIDNQIRILLSSKNTGLYESEPLNIRLANVDESLDCKIRIISDIADLDFSVTDSKQKTLSNSTQEDKFISYSVSSSNFHLEDLKEFSFNLVFASKTDTVLINKIVLSFPKNKQSLFLSSPGVLTITKDNSKVNNKAIQFDSFLLTGNNITIASNNRIYCSDNVFTTSVKLKNNGDSRVRVFLGYEVYNRNHECISNMNYPYNNTNNVMRVVTSDVGSNSIIVDSYPEWEKNGYLAINAKEDMSDIPNGSFADGRIVEIKKISDNQAEIIMDKPQTKKIETGTGVRINSHSSRYLWTNREILQPNEEKVYSSTIQKDNDFLQFSKKAFPRGAYYIVPILQIISLDADKEASVFVSDYTISY